MKKRSKEKARDNKEVKSAFERKNSREQRKEQFEKWEKVE